MQFNSSPTSSIGAEIELQLLDRNSLDLVDGILPLLEACPDTRYVQPEYIQFTVEIASKVCQDIMELEEHLLSQVAMLQRTAHQLGIRLAASGTHPFCDRLGIVTPSPRYAQVERDTGYVGYSQITYALHVHVGIRSGEEAIALMRRLRPYLPVLLALSANSPFWRGLDTGFASYRQRVLMAAHAFGMPPPLDSWADFEALVRTSERAHIFETFQDMHWDLRPRPDYGTLEIRVMDVQPTVAEVTALVATVQALTDYLRTPRAREQALPTLPIWLEQENHYRASHEGLAADCVIGAEGETRPMREVAGQMLDAISPHARERGAGEQLDRARQLLRSGGNCALQRGLYQETGSLKLVVGHLADRLSDELARHLGSHPPPPPTSQLRPQRGASRP